MGVRNGLIHDLSNWSGLVEIFTCLLNTQKSKKVALKIYQPSNGILHLVYQEKQSTIYQMCVSCATQKVTVSEEKNFAHSEPKVIERHWETFCHYVPYVEGNLPCNVTMVPIHATPRHPLLLTNKGQFLGVTASPLLHTARSHCSLMWTLEQFKDPHFQGYDLIVQSFLL